MKAIKFDEEKVKKCIESYYDQYEKYPYLVMNKETYKILPAEKKSITLLSDDCNITMPATYCSSITVSGNPINKNPESIKIDDTEYIKRKSEEALGEWHKATILIDNNLEFGEVHIG